MTVVLGTFGLMEEESTAKIRQAAAERRKRILEDRPHRLGKIQGVQNQPKHELEGQCNEPKGPKRDTGFVSERELHHEVKKSIRSPLRGMENLAVVVKQTRRALIGMAVLIGSLYAFGKGPPEFNPFSFLLITQVSIVASMWSYFLLNSGAYKEQVERLRMEAKFKRLSGQDWKPKFLFWIPGLTPFLNTIDNFRICMRGFTEPVSVFIVTFVLVKTMISMSQQSHQCCSMHNPGSSNMDHVLWE